MQMACKSEIFMDKYKFSDIEKAEVSNFKAGEHKQIDYAIFLDVNSPFIIPAIPSCPIIITNTTK